MNWYITVLKNYVGFEGRSQRAEYWYFTLINLIAGLILSYVSPHPASGIRVGGLSTGFGGSSKASPRHGKIGMVVVTDFSAADRSDLGWSWFVGQVGSKVKVSSGF